jgi:hypothetical protein
MKEADLARLEWKEGVTMIGLKNLVQKKLKALSDMP